MDLIAYIMIGLSYLSGIIVGVLVARKCVSMHATDLIRENKKKWFTEGYTVALLDASLTKKKEKKNHENINTTRDGNVVTIHRHGYSAGRYK